MQVKITLKNPINILCVLLRNNTLPPVDTSPCTSRLETRNLIPLTDIRVYLLFHFPFSIPPSVFTKFLPRQWISIFFNFTVVFFIVIVILLCYFSHLILILRSSFRLFCSGEEN